jgi:CBS domain-containing protein
MYLEAQIAADLMTSNPISVREEATFQEAIALLTDKGLSAAPVVNQAGRAIGALSRADILVHEREQLTRKSSSAEDPTRVRDIMTPAVFSVWPESPAKKVIEEMLAMNVHQLFVVDRGGTLVGVISALDILRRLR